MRDHTKLRAFELADEVALLAYKSTAETTTSSLQPHPSSLFNDAGGIRTRNREGLSFAAVPVRVPRHARVVWVGFEPTNTEV